MLATPEFLVARPRPALLPIEDARAPIRVLIASLARGGAERIVLEWLVAELRRGRTPELAVLHPRANAWRAPPGIGLIERRGETPEAFVASLAARWRNGAGAISTHLVDDALLAILWAQGIATIPTVHNARPGWRNDPARWRARDVPHAIACADAVACEVRAADCAVPVAAIRHWPEAPRGAADPAARKAIRDAWGVDDETLLIAAVGAFKPQKDFVRALETLAVVRRSRKAALAILGGVLDSAQLAEFGRTLDRIASLGIAAHVKLPGFVDPIGPWYAAGDVLLSASRYEGLSMASREALAAGLPVVALDVGGQRETQHVRLALLPPAASTREIAAAIAQLPVRASLATEAPQRAPRVWSVATAWHRREHPVVDTLFVTANLNAGGAQRSLVNLACAIAHRHRIAIAVCGETTHDAFAESLRRARVSTFRPASSPDPFAIAESLLARVHRDALRTLCFWNVDPRVKLLVAKFLPEHVRLVDASPGGYAFEELEGEGRFAETVTSSPAAYYKRLDVLVLKHAARAHPTARSTRVIPNGVAIPASRSRRPDVPRFLVSGRIAPSKRLETIVSAFARVRPSLPGAELHIVGQAEERHARYAASIAGAASGLPVRFRGAAADLAHLAEDFTGTVVLGTHQGCPNAVLEAMAAGIPVIANDSGGTAELVCDRETGWLLTESVPEAELAEAMLACARDPARADAIAARARDHARRHFSIEAMSDRYLDCFEHAR